MLFFKCQLPIVCFQDIKIVYFDRLVWCPATVLDSTGSSGDLCVHTWGSHVDDQVT